MKLMIICRDGYVIHNFCRINNIDETNIQRIKSAQEVVDTPNNYYVIINPLPYTSNEILEQLEMEGCINITKKYKLK